MKTFEIVKNLMRENKITKQTDLARIIYKKDKIDTKERVKVSSYLAGMTNFPDDALKNIAEYFGVTLDFLKGLSLEKEVKFIPVIGTASCGGADINHLEDSFKKALYNGEFWKKSLYCVIANGDSMSPEIDDGDEVIVDPDVKCQTGDMVHYKIDNESAIKVLVIEEDAHLIQFVPYNTNEVFKIKTIRLDDEETMAKLTYHKVVSVNKLKFNNRSARLKLIGR